MDKRNLETLLAHNGHIRAPVCMPLCTPVPDNDQRWQGVRSGRYGRAIQNIHDTAYGPTHTRADSNPNRITLHCAHYSTESRPARIRIPHQSERSEAHPPPLYIHFHTTHRTTAFCTHSTPSWPHCAPKQRHSRSNKPFAKSALRQNTLALDN